jgi:hypothetical protein
VTWRVVNVIEAEMNQLLGVSIQALSLRKFGASCEHSVVVIDRHRGNAEAVATHAQRLGLQCSVAASCHENPFLNRWAIWSGFADCRTAPRIALWDWDIACVAKLEWPAVARANVAARGNPVKMYRHHTLPLLELLPRSRVNAAGDVLCSINGGVQLGTGEDLFRVSELHRQWHELLKAQAPRAADWELEQLALSLAVGEVGWQRLADPWNVTPTSPVADQDVVLWHYNDGHEHSHRMKRNLLSPEIARESLAALSERWPKTVAQFSSLYEQAVELSGLELNSK